MLYVEIVNTKTDKVVKRMGPMNERAADRVESGAMINLNHAEYHTRIVKANDKFNQPHRSDNTASAEN